MNLTAIERRVAALCLGIVPPVVLVWAKMPDGTRRVIIGENPAGLVPDGALVFAGGEAGQFCERTAAAALLSCVSAGPRTAACALSPSKLDKFQRALLRKAVRENWTSREGVPAQEIFAASKGAQ